LLLQHLSEFKCNITGQRIDHCWTSVTVTTAVTTADHLALTGRSLLVLRVLLVLLVLLEFVAPDK
jgi:hypothetical protein